MHTYGEADASPPLCRNRVVLQLAGTWQMHPYNAKQIQEWLGHESILETMDTYGHLFPRDLHEVCERLDAYVVEQMEITAERKMLA